MNKMRENLFFFCSCRTGHVSAHSPKFRAMLLLVGALLLRLLAKYNKIITIGKLNVRIICMFFNFVSQQKSIINRTKFGFTTTIFQMIVRKKSVCFL